MFSRYAVLIFGGASLVLHVIGGVGVENLPHYGRRNNSPIEIEIVRPPVAQVKMPDKPIPPMPPPPKTIAKPEEEVVTEPVPEARPPEPVQPDPALADNPQGTNAKVTKLSRRPASPTAGASDVEGNGGRPGIDGTGGGQAGWGSGAGSGSGGFVAVVGPGGTGTGASSEAAGAAGMYSMKSALAAVFGFGGSPGSYGAGGGGGTGGGGSPSKGGASTAGSPLGGVGVPTGTTSDPSKQTPAPDNKPRTVCPDGTNAELTSDAMHCGSCDKACRPNQKCIASTCSGGDDRQYRVVLLNFHPPAEMGMFVGPSGDHHNGFYDQFIWNFNTLVGNAVKSNTPHKPGDDSAAGLQFETTVNNMVASGLTNMLFDIPTQEHATDPVRIFEGSAPGSVNPATPPAVLVGGLLVDPVYDFANPPGVTPPALTFTIPEPTGLTLRLPISVDTMHIDLSLTPPTGWLRGSIRVQTLMGSDSFVGEVAKALDAILQDPKTPLAEKLGLKGFFDAGFGLKGADCTNADGTKGVPNDGKISLCEMKAVSPAYEDMLLPDAKLYTSGGAYFPKLPQPNCSDPKSQKLCDSLTMGLEFQLQKVEFQ